MAFWSDPDLREPLRQNRWYMFFNPYNLKTGNQTLINNIEKYKFALKECTKPEYKIETSQHVLLNHTFNYPKNLVWQPINISFVCPVMRDEDGDTDLLSSELTPNIMGYSIPSAEQKTVISKDFSLRKIQIIQIDTNGFPIEIWDLSNCLFSSVQFGNLTYENDSFVEIKVTIVYDFASQTSTDTNSTIKTAAYINNKKIEGSGTQFKYKEERLDMAISYRDDAGNLRRLGWPGFADNKAVW